MDWKSLPAFLAVARTGSLRDAVVDTGGTHSESLLERRADFIG
jgi:DNA-binding transcriptional LysR family regulator